MSPPSVRVNTFVEQNEKLHIDPISKMFLIVEVMFGLDRMPLLGKGSFIYVGLSFIIFIIVNCAVLYMVLFGEEVFSIDIIMVVFLSENVLSTLLSFVRCKWMLRFYRELGKFDAKAGCRPKVSTSSIQNAVQASLVCIFIVILFVVPVGIGMSVYSPNHFIPLHIINVLELHYFGHLLSLLTPRLKLINYHIESSLSSSKVDHRYILKNFVPFKSFEAQIAQCQIRTQMDLYQIVVEAYDFLNEGIKWQWLLTIITAFITVLGFLYEFSFHAIHFDKILTEKSALQVGVPVVIMVSLFSPCIISDSVHNEVKTLRELLASRLYENKLNKSGRSVARALLALTETRDLSFRLLRMLNIDISLPFKFLGLLVTYLIIFLQFEKVMHP